MKPEISGNDVADEIEAAMSKTPIYSDRRALEVILRWCDRGGEEPEGHCLYEIERIAKGRLVTPSVDTVAKARAKAKKKAAKRKK